MKLTKRIVIIPAAAMLLLSGCAASDAYKNSISKFNEASLTVINNAGKEYTSVNKNERNAEIDRRVNRGEQITLAVLNSDDLVVISKDAMKARTDALDVLKEHGKLLVKLVNSSSPKESQDAVKALNDAAMKLSGSLGAAPSDKFKNTAGAVATIAGEITKLVMEKKIKEGLDKAIKMSEKDISELITLLEQEIVDVISARRKSALSEVRLAAAERYNSILAQSPSDLDKLHIAGEAVKKAEDDWDNVLNPPDLGFEKMRTAHKELVKYAKGEQTEKKLNELADAMTKFADEVKVIADALKNIK